MSEREKKTFSRVLSSTLSKFKKDIIAMMCEQFEKSSMSDFEKKLFQMASSHIQEDSREEMPGFLRAEKTFYTLFPVLRENFGRMFVDRVAYSMCETIAQNVRDWSLENMELKDFMYANPEDALRDAMQEVHEAVSQSIRRMKKEMEEEILKIKKEREASKSDTRETYDVH